MPEERRFRLPGLTLAAREWHPHARFPLIALHGWLDNAGSFDLLAPQLPRCHLLALDTAGHGASGFRSADADYSLWEDAGDVLRVADRMGWRTFSLLGHSRGAGVATLLAGAVPERVERLVLIEGGLPIPAEANEAPETLAAALAERDFLARRRGRVFAQRDAAIAQRAMGFSRISTQAAEILARRSLRRVAGGFQWHVDPRLKGTSPLRLTPDQIRAFVERVRAPVLMVVAEESPFRNRPIYRRLVPCFRDLRMERLPGGHHLHLEGAQDGIARRIRAFFAVPADGPVP